MSVVHGLIDLINHCFAVFKPNFAIFCYWKSPCGSLVPPFLFQAIALLEDFDNF